jgi:PAS domain S-box-containing protein
VKSNAQKRHLPPTASDALFSRYRRLVEAAGDVIYSTDANGYIDYVNASVERLLGFSPDQVIGQHFSAFVHPDWKQKVIDYYVDQFKTRRPETIFEFPLMTASGETKWGEQVVMTVIEDDRVVAFNGFIRDLTERKRIEQNLLESQQRYHDLFEQIDDAIFVHDEEANILEVNEAACRRLGYSREELLRMKTTDIDAPDYAAGFKDRLARQLYDGKLSNISGTHITRDGRQILIDVNSRAITYQGKLAVLAVVRDITQIRRNEESLRRSEERYRIIVEDQAELICRWRADTTLTFVNDAYCRYFNKTRQELEGISFLTLVPESYHAGIRAQIERALATGESIMYEHPVIMKGGKTRWQEWTDRPLFDDAGVFVEFQSVGRDATERKLAENERNDYIHRLEIIQNVDTALMEQLNIDYVEEIALQAAVSISLADAGAIHVLEGNQLRVAQVTGNFPPSMIGAKFPLTRGIIGRVARRRIPELVSDVTGDPDYVHNVIETRAQMTLPLLTQNQLIGVLNVQTAQPDRFTPQMFDFLKVLAARIASALENAQLHHTTEKQLAELQELYQQVSNLEQLKTQMIRIAAHDLRNPLGIISGYLQMLRMDLGAQLLERNQGHLDIIGDSVNRIDKITRNILTLERVSPGREILSDSLDLRQLVSQAFEESRPQAVQKLIDYQLQLTSATLYAQGDRYLLPETFTNLIANAIKYTGHSGQVRVKLYAEETHAIFEVEDTGFGIPEDQQAKLFEPFFRVKTNETRDIPGSGLGLHLVKTIIERHGGEMRFRSVYGQGSTFGFELPLVAAPKAASKRRAAAKT